jgi:hypothetical protein
MRAVLCAVGVCLALGGLAIAQEGKEWKWGERYSHVGHASKLEAKGKRELACKSCHQLRASDLSPIAPGKNNHKPCTDCHGPTEFARGPKCLTCHSNVRGFKPGKPWFPPYLSPGEFHIAFPHAKHVGQGQAADNCGGCHAKEEGKPTSASGGRSHGACGVCHARDVKPDMNDCAACHQPGLAPQVAHPAEQPSDYRVTAKFDHASHAQKVTARGLKPSCASCHIGLGAQETPGRPNMQVCEGCHDGKTAFDARGTRCDRCHATPPNAHLSAMPAKALFRHQPHQQLGVHVEQCTLCHGVGMDWKAVQAGHNQHQPCQGCHAGEFRMRDQPICLTCHERNDPFAPNPLRPPHENTSTSEWRLGDVPHPPHLAAGVPCVTCHQKEAGQRAQNGGHSLCGQCHKDGAKTPLSSCGACHVSVTVPRAATVARPWSTRARFPHDERHRGEKCESCHTKPGAPDLTAPSMQFCADRCHDGTRAFKVSGFQCARCHSTVARP